MCVFDRMFRKKIIYLGNRKYFGNRKRSNLRAFINKNVKSFNYTNTQQIFSQIHMNRKKKCITQFCDLTSY